MFRRSSKSKSKSKTKSKHGHSQSSSGLVPDHYADKKASDSCHSATERAWASPIKTPATRTTSEGKLVVSVLVEILNCASLAASESYVKVKLAKPNKKGVALDLHKTKVIKNT